MSRSFRYLWPLVILTAALSAQGQSKLTDAAARRLAGSALPAIYWVFIEPEGWADQPIEWSDRSSQRRARVDPQTFLQDERDFPIATAVIDSITSAGLTIRHASRWLKAVSVEGIPGAVAKVQAWPFVKRIDVVRVWRARIPDEQDGLDKHAPSMGQMENDYGFSTFQNQFVNAPPLHNLGLNGRGVIIAIFDTGFDTAHPGLATATIAATYDFIHNAADVTTADCPDQVESNRQTSHGTAVLGVLAADLPDTLLGVARGATFVLAKTEITCDDVEIRLEEDNWIAAAEWVDSLGADIITSSLGYYYWQDDQDYILSDLDGNTAYITQAADIAASKNILVISSAGNERGSAWGRITFPADGDSVLAVGAVTADSSIASFSSPGPTADGRIKPDVATLGVNVLTLRSAPERGLRYGSGTSFAAPLVAGVAALAMERNPSFSADRIFELIRTTADRSANPDNNFGYGLVDAYRAADLIYLEEIPTIHVELGRTVDLIVVTSGGAGVVPSLNILDPPPGVAFEDLHDGRGHLAVAGVAENFFEVTFRIEALANGVADTQEVTLQTFGASDLSVYAGPNPFADTVSFYSDSTAGTIRTVTVYTVSGEKVWEKVNHSARSADESSSWDMVQWSGRTMSGQPVAPGVYLAVVEAAHHRAMLKLLKHN